MEIVLSPRALEDLLFWKVSGNKQVQQKIQNLLTAIQVDPFNGIGQPEPLKYSLTGFWSRRINKEHRIVYDPRLNPIEITSLKGHYLEN